MLLYLAYGRRKFTPHTTNAMYTFFHDKYDYVSLAEFLLLYLAYGRRKFTLHTTNARYTFFHDKYDYVSLAEFFIHVF